MSSVKKLPLDNNEEEISEEVIIYPQILPIQILDDNQFDHSDDDNDEKIEGLNSFSKFSLSLVSPPTMLDDYDYNLDEALEQDIPSEFDMPKWKTFKKNDV